MKFIKKLISYFKVDQFDPVRNCKVYKTIGCCHVDGFLCDMRTCEKSHTVWISPKSIINVDGLTNK